MNDAIDDWSMDCSPIKENFEAPYFIPLSYAFGTFRFHMKFEISKGSRDCSLIYIYIYMLQSYAFISRETFYKILKKIVSKILRVLLIELMSVECRLTLFSKLSPNHGR